MNSKDIVIGEYYRLKSSPKYGYVKALLLIKPMSKYKREREYRFQNIPEDLPMCYIVKCEHVVDKGDTFGFIRYFKINRFGEGINYDCIRS